MERPEKLKRDQKKENRLSGTVKSVKNMFVKRETAGVKHIGRILKRKVKEFYLI